MRRAEGVTPITVPEMRGLSRRRQLASWIMRRSMFPDASISFSSRSFAERISNLRWRVQKACAGEVVSTRRCVSRREEYGTDVVSRASSRDVPCSINFRATAFVLAGRTK